MAGRFMRCGSCVAKTNTPAALEAVCLKAMARNPSDRYASALDLARDVENWLADEPPSAWREPLRSRAGRWIRKHQRLTAVTLTLGFVAIVAAAAATVWCQTTQAELQAKRRRVTQETTTALDRVAGAIEQLSKTLKDSAKAEADVEAVVVYAGDQSDRVFIRDGRRDSPLKTQIYGGSRPIC